MCYREIVAVEARRRSTYAWLLRTRTDLVYLADIRFDTLSTTHAHVPYGGMTDHAQTACTNDHMFFCPRHLCRPYFELLELWESAFCIAANVPPVTLTHTNGPHAIPKDEPRAPFWVPPPPHGAAHQWYILARYNCGRRCASDRDGCCGLLRELRYPYAFARGDAERGLLDCRLRLVCLMWRGGNYSRTQLENQNATEECQSLHKRYVHGAKNLFQNGHVKLPGPCQEWAANEGQSSKSSTRTFMAFRRTGGITGGIIIRPGQPR